MTTQSGDKNQESGEQFEFTESDEATAFLKSRLRYVPNADANLIQEVAGQFEILRKVPIEAHLPPGSIPILVKRFRWVIRNDDLNLVDCILEGVKASAAAGFFLAAGIPAPAQWGAIVGVGAAIFKVFRGALLRGMQLDSDLFTVLAALKCAGKLSTDDLAAKLALTDPDWDIVTARKALETLEAIPMADGTIRQLVSQHLDGDWQVSGI